MSIFRRRLMLNTIKAPAVIIMTTETNPEVLAVCYAQGWCANSDYMTEKEAKAVTSVGTVFNGNTSITHFEEFAYFTSITSAGTSAFRNCTALAAITFPESLNTIGDRAFASCPLVNIRIPKNVSSIYYNAFSKSTIESIVVDANNATYDSRNNCNAIIATSSDTLLCGCKNTIIPSDIKVIGGQSFNYTAIGPNLVLPEGVSEIGAYAFAYCRSMGTITLPSTITNIATYAFQNSRLTSVTILTTTPPTLGTNAFTGQSNSFKIYVPAASVDAYKSAWSGYASLIEAIN